MSPVFSPDGTRIAYTVNDALATDGTHGSCRRCAARRAGGCATLRASRGWSGSDLLFSEIKAAIRTAHGHRAIE